MQTKKEKASALAVTVIILGLVLTIALGASLTSILERKASLSSGDSNTAYQKADAGVERTLKLLNDNEDKKLNELVEIDCTDGAVINSSENNYKIELKNESGAIITDCTADVASVKWLKSVGTADQNKRVIEVAVAIGVNAGITGGCRVGWSIDAYKTSEVWGSGCIAEGDAATSCRLAADTGYSCGSAGINSDNTILFCLCVESV